MYEIDFLPVGDGERCGDAIALRFQTQSMSEPVVVVVDGGYQDDGPALAEHIRTHYGAQRINLMVSTHPDADHVNGLIALLDEMPVDELMVHQPWRHSTEMLALARGARTQKALFGAAAGKFEKSMAATVDLEAKAIAYGIPIVEPFAGETRFGGALTVVGPDQTFYESLLPDFRKGKDRKVGPESATELLLKALRSAAEQVVQAVKEALDLETLTDAGVTSAENESSVILHLAVDGRRLLLTADAGMDALTWAADYMDARGLNTAPLSLMQIPHHGSKRNVGPTILNRLLGEPGSQAAVYAAVASAAKAAPKHPAKRVTNAFTRRGAHVTTTEGNTLMISNTKRDGWGPVEAVPFYEDVSSDDND
jgi:beta-lactamase superfamily II metal-dependent hydrolase